MKLNLEAKELYGLKLHESMRLSNGTVIMRVPGGWIYDCWDCEVGTSKAGTFVPFNNEFMDYSVS